MNVLPSQAPITFTEGSLPNLTASCLSTLPSPSLFGADILAVTSFPVSNYTAQFMPPSFFNSDPPQYGEATDLSFCNVTVTYTHPGQNDEINVNLWLPLSVSEAVHANDNIQKTAQPTTNTTSPSWNGLFLSIGGGGYSMCLPDVFVHASLSQGYAISKTDGGHLPVGSVDSPTESWAMLSPGNVNLYLLQDFGSVALHDMAVIGKSIVESFYGMPPRHSYFQGCSTGGRQGLMLAQRYSDDYDGILTAAPAIHFPKLMVSHYWAQMTMNMLGEYPKGCEFAAITKAAIEKCDELDGVKDGIVAAPERCHFDPFEMVGDVISCTETYVDDELQKPTTHKVSVTYAAAEVASSLWRGPVDTDNTSLWYGLPRSAPLSAFATTACFKNGTCTGLSDSLIGDWFRLFLYKDPGLTNQDLSARITHEEFVRLFTQSTQEYNSFLATDNPDLRAFARKGKKMITWHGIDDGAIMMAQSIGYYDQIVRPADKSTHPREGASVNNVEDFYRLFLVPGIQHCGGGNGALPINVMAKLRAWVEDGVAPDVLEGESFPSKEEGKEKKLYRPLCMYPSVARYKGHGDMRRKESFECVATF